MTVANMKGKRNEEHFYLLGPNQQISLQHIFYLQVIMFIKLQCIQFEQKL